MNGQASWIDLVVPLAGAAGIAAWLIWSWWALRQYQDEPRDVVCPQNGARVEATLVWDSKEKHWTGVRRCAAFRDPEKVTCELKCVDRLNPRTG